MKAKKNKVKKPEVSTTYTVKTTGEGFSFTATFSKFDVMKGYLDSIYEKHPGPENTTITWECNLV